MSNDPLTRELVVARVQRPGTEPLLVREAIYELRVRDDASAIRGRAAGDAGYATVQGVGGCGFGSTTCEAAGGEGLEGSVAGGDRWVIKSPSAVVSPDHAYVRRIVEAGEDVLQHRGRPVGIVIGEDDDWCGGWVISRDPEHHLFSLVRLVSGKELDLLIFLFAEVCLRKQRFEVFDIGRRGHEHNTLRLVRKPGAQSDQEIRIEVDRRHNERDIALWDVLWFLRKTNWVERFPGKTFEQGCSDGCQAVGNQKGL